MLPAVSEPQRSDEVGGVRTGLLVGLILATLLFPIVGIVAGIVYLARNKIGPGLAMLVTAVLGFFIAFLLLAAIESKSQSCPSWVPEDKRDQLC
jgi:hypothetical protein